MMKRFWWVNQKQTYKQEVEGVYLWSPKRNANGARNPFFCSGWWGDSGYCFRHFSTHAWLQVTISTRLVIQWMYNAVN